MARAAAEFDTSRGVLLDGELWEFTGGLLGSGSFGAVFEAESVSSGREAAIKVIDLEPLSDWQRKQCEAEPLMWAKLSHPHITCFFGSLRIERWLLIVSESVNGGELMDHIASRHHFTEAETSSIMGQLLSAVDHMHERGICHRDIKPQNILCAEPPPNELVTSGELPKWNVKLCDFGMSKELRDDAAVMSTPCGSKHYVAPEVLSHRYGKKADIWALGCIGYLLLCGSSPPATEAQYAAKVLPALAAGEAWKVRRHTRSICSSRKIAYWHCSLSPSKRCRPLRRRMCLKGHWTLCSSCSPSIRMRE